MYQNPQRSSKIFTPIFPSAVSTQILTSQANVNPALQLSQPAMVPQTYASQVVVPQVQTLAPPVQSIVPQVQSVVPQVQSVVPQVQSVVPQVQSVVPQVQSVVPQVQSVVPQVQSVVPQVQSVVPQVQSIVPQVQSVVPQVQAMPGYAPMAQAPTLVNYVMPLGSRLPMAQDHMGQNLTNFNDIGGSIYGRVSIIR